MDIETTKIANVFESPVAGVLRKMVAPRARPCRSARSSAWSPEPGVPDAEVETFVAEFLGRASSRRKKAEAARPAPRVDDRRRRIRYLESAGPDDGTPVVLIHGFGADLNYAGCSTRRRSPRTAGLSRSTCPATAARQGRRRRRDARRLADAVADVHGRGRHRRGASRRPFARRRGRDADRFANRRSASRRLTLIAPGGLGPEIARTFIDGFIAETRARKLETGARDAGADPALVTADMVEDVLKIQTARRRGRRARDDRRRRISSAGAARLAPRTPRSISRCRCR